MFPIVVRGIEDTTEVLLAGGVNVMLALADRAACLDSRIARHHTSVGPGWSVVPAFPLGTSAAAW
jgi:hypothetical protein